MADEPLPQAFVWRRLHSLFGFFLALFLIMHLTTNSQAALLVGQDGKGFIHEVNFIHSLPYLIVIEVAGLGLLIALHAIWGIRYLLTAESNVGRGDGSKVSLPDFPKNRAYSWQRITSWILLVGIVLHVVQMRVMRYPVIAPYGDGKGYIVRVTMDRGLYSVAERLGVVLYDVDKIADARLALNTGGTARKGESGSVSFRGLMSPVASGEYNEEEDQHIRREAQRYDARQTVRALEALPLQEGDVAAVAPDVGTAILLTVRDIFKYPFNIVLYAIFVPAATFHAFNGLWTFFITWGITLTSRSQQLAKKLCLVLLAALTLLGWAAVFGTYWINLRY